MIQEKALAKAQKRLQKRLKQEQRQQQKQLDYTMQLLEKANKALKSVY